MHVRTHTREHLYYCSQCHYSSITKNCLKRHVIQKHSNILLKCPTDGCDYSTPDKYKLQAHLKVHTELVSRSPSGGPVPPGCSRLAHCHAFGGVPAACQSGVSVSTLKPERSFPWDRLCGLQEPSPQGAFWIEYIRFLCEISHLGWSLQDKGLQSRREARVSSAALKGHCPQ